MSGQRLQFSGSYSQPLTRSISASSWHLAWTSPWGLGNASVQRHWVPDHLHLGKFFSVSTGTLRFVFSTDQREIMKKRSIRLKWNSKSVIDTTGKKGAFLFITLYSIQNFRFYIKNRFKKQCFLLLSRYLYPLLNGSSYLFTFSRIFGWNKSLEITIKWFVKIIFQPKTRLKSFKNH